MINLTMKQTKLTRTKITWLAGLLSVGMLTFAADAPMPLYENSFEQAEVGAVPNDLMVLGGEFVVKREGTNQFLELPGAPLDSFAVQFGPAAKSDLAVSARIFGTNKGRRSPGFGVGLGGVSGWKLQLSPAKEALELLKDQELKATVKRTWTPGTWTQLKLQIHQVKEGEWQVTGKAWPQGSSEPNQPDLALVTTLEPPQGKASILGSPFSGTPIWFDDLRVEKVTP